MSKKGINTQKGIFSYDPFAQDLIKEIYESLRDKVDSGQTLSIFEQDVMERILNRGDANTKEITHISSLLDQAYQILDSADTWDKEHEELNEVLEKVVFLGAREGAFKNYFSILEESICDLLTLDFSSKLKYTDTINDKRNLLNYVAASLNMIIETLEPAVVSRKVLNTFISDFPQLVVFVTDVNKKIRFLSGNAENLLGVKSFEVVGKPITQFMDADIDLSVCERGGTISRDRVELKGINQNHILNDLSVRKALEDPMEVTEYIYILKDTNKNDDKSSATNDQLGCINQIIGAAEYLKKSATEDQKFFVDTILTKAWELRDDIGGSIKESLLELPDGYDYIYINEIIERIAEATMKEAGSFDWEFVNTFEGDFYSRPGMFAYLVQNLLLSSLHFEATAVQLKIEEWNSGGISMRFVDNAIGSKDAENAFTKIIVSIVEALGGELEKPDHSCIVIRLPKTVQEIS